MFRSDDRSFIFFRALAALVLLSGCSHVSDEKLTTENRSVIATDVSSSSMSERDKNLFAAANKRAESGDYDVTDKTVAQIIQDESAFEAEKTAEENQARQLADEARAKEEARRRALASALTVAFIRKSFVPADFENAQYDSFLQIELAFKNTSSKAIRSLKGVVHFENSLGDTIKSAPLSYEETIMPGKSVSYAGSLKFNQFDDSDVKLRDAESRNIQMHFEADTVLFTDGSRLTSADSDATHE